MPATPQRSSIPKWAQPAVLVFTGLIFLKAVFNDFVSLDDETYIFNNPYIKNFSAGGIRDIFLNPYFGMYHPLTMLSYLLEYTWFGLNPLPYHLFNVVLHLLNIWMAFRVTERLSGNKIAAVVVALLFAVHPMHVESVAWVSERKDLLYSFFFLWSMNFYLDYLENNFRTKTLLLVALTFIASLLSKPAAITLPVVLFALDIYKERKITTRAVMEKVPLLALSVISGLTLMMAVQQKTFDFLSISYSPVDRIFLISYNIAFYLVKLVAPFELSAIYYYPNPSGGSLPWFYYASLPFLLIVGFLVFKTKKYRRELFFAFAFYLITVSVMLQIVPNGLAIVCDRYTYIPYLGFFYLIGQWIADQSKGPKRNLVVTSFSVVIILFSALTLNRIGVWKNGETLMTDVIHKSPGIFHCYWMRGNIRNKNGNLKGALQDYNKTIEYDATYDPGYSDRSTVRLSLGDVNGALEDLNTAIRLDPEVPKYYNNRAAVFDQSGDPASALNDYNKAIELDPEMAEAYINRSMLRAKSGDLEGAMTDIERSVVLSPTTPETYSTRGTIRSMLKDYKGAAEDIHRSLKLKPDDTLAYYNLGLLHLFMNDTAASCPYFNKAVKLGSNSAIGLADKYCR